MSTILNILNLPEELRMLVRSYHEIYNLNYRYMKQLKNYFRDFDYKLMLKYLKSYKNHKCYYAYQSKLKTNIFSKKLKKHIDLGFIDQSNFKPYLIPDMPTKLEKCFF